MRCDTMRSARPGRRSRAPPSPGPGAPRPPGSRSRSPGPAPRQQRSPEPGRGVPAARGRPALLGSPRAERGPGAPVPLPSLRGPRPWQPRPGELPARGGSGDSGRDPRPGRLPFCGGGRARDAGLGQGQRSRCALRAGKFCVVQNKGPRGGEVGFSFVRSAHFGVSDHGSRAVARAVLPAPLETRL